MLESLEAVAYRVSDLAEAKHWYRRIFDKEPVLDSPLAVVFLAGTAKFTLLPIDHPPARGGEPTVAYWGVEDIDAVYRRLLELGATSQSDIYVTAAGTRIARVVDPFGNVLGIASRPSGVKKQSLDEQPSASAMGVALSRAQAAVEEREEIRGPDHLAHIFLTDDFKRLLHDPAAREWLRRKVPGSYEFFIARTAFFDRIVAEALEQNVPQIVFLGAGYDTRAYRFRDILRDTRIFELDGDPTQRRKRRLLEQAGVAIPPRLTYVSINFLREDLAGVLAQAGYDPTQKTLFVWEGVAYYLTAQAVDQTLAFVRSCSQAGSILCFDYLADAPDMADRYGVRQSREAMRAAYTAEPIQFAIAEGAIRTFLAERGFSLIEHLTDDDLEKKYLTLRDGSLAGQVLACFRLVKASTSP